MLRHILIFLAACLLSCLLWAESTGNNWLALGFKTPLSILFVITVLVQPKVFSKYFKFVLIGLILGLVGDVCLALPGLTAFRVGLVAFLAGHILYILAFAILTRRVDWINPVNILIIAVSGCVYLWLLPHLGKMLVPVTFYIVVISVMVAAAWAAFRNPRVRRVVHTGWRSVFLCLRHLCRASAIRHRAILQSAHRTSAVLHRPVSPGILSWSGKKAGDGKS